MSVFLFRIVFFVFARFLDTNGVRWPREELLRAGSMYPDYEFDVLHHLTGIAPYFEGTRDQLNPSPPSNCKVDRTSYLIRHGSVYVDDYDYLKVIQPFLTRLNRGQISRSSAQLNFLTKWKSPLTNPKEQIEQLTKLGLFESFQLGFQLASRYPHLLPARNDKTFRVWAASSDRTRESATSMFKGLFGGRKSVGRVIVIAENKTRGANSLTPTKSCAKYDASKGAKEAHLWLAQYTRAIIARLSSTLVPNDILAMQQLCGYESVIRGSSPFCQLFTAEEWIAFEYYFDLKYDQEIGYGNSLSPHLGMPWLKATADLLTDRTKSSQKMFLSVTHREMLPIILVALGLFNQSMPLSTNEINPDRLWKTSFILPFLGRIALERLQCSSRHMNGSFVRILVNSVVKPVSTCSNGPGQSCPLNDFAQYIERRQAQYGQFSRTCQRDSILPDQLTFFNDKS